MATHLATGASGFTGAAPGEFPPADGHTVAGVDNLNDRHGVRLKDVRRVKVEITRCVEGFARRFETMLPWFAANTPRKPANVQANAVTRTVAAAAAMTKVANTRPIVTTKGKFMAATRAAEGRKKSNFDATEAATKMTGGTIR